MGKKTFPVPTEIVENYNNACGAVIAAFKPYAASDRAGAGLLFGVYDINGAEDFLDKCARKVRKKVPNKHLHCRYEFPEKTTPVAVIEWSGT